MLGGILLVCGARRLTASQFAFRPQHNPAPSLHRPQDALGFGSPSLRVGCSNWFEKRKTHHRTNSVVSLLACLEGFEPPTLWFVAKYSIQLSYKHILFNFIYCSNPGFYPFAVPEIPDFDRGTALRLRFFRHRRHSGSVPPTFGS